MTQQVNPMLLGLHPEDTSASHRTSSKPRVWLPYVLTDMLDLSEATFSSLRGHPELFKALCRALSCYEVRRGACPGGRPYLRPGGRHDAADTLRDVASCQCACAGRV